MSECKCKRAENGEVYERHPRCTACGFVAVSSARSLLTELGFDITHPDLADTPARMVRALAEMTAGYDENPAALLSKTFEATYDEMVVLRDIEFTSLCEHHLLPFSGVAHVGYVPGARVVGLSKLARVVQCFARRLQMQERLTRQVAESLMEHLGAQGAGVVVEAHHFCMGCRGVKQPRARMVTSALLGCMRERETRAEFLGFTRR